MALNLWQIRSGDGSMDSEQLSSHAILFADIADSTRLYDRLGDAVARDLVVLAIGIMKTEIRDNAGEVIKTIGDGVMGRFPSADAAAEAAIRLHEALALQEHLKSNNLRLRIGLHVGPVIEENDDLYGDAVNVAARMMAQAKAGQIIASRQTVQMLNSKHSASARMVDQTRVKGKACLMDIFEITWGQPEELTIIRSKVREMVPPAFPLHTLMTLKLQRQHVSIDLEHPIVTLGRNESNILVVDNPEVSRLHARIEFRKDKFILIDQSTNGTYLYPTGCNMLYLRRDEVLLEGRGFFGLGQEVGHDSPMAVHYMCM
jgi:class 3 adenylate cyclase